MYLSYEKYVVMGGELSLSAYLRLCRLAEAKVSQLTFGRISRAESLREDIEYLIFDLIPIYERLKEAESGEKPQSFSHDGISVSYKESDTSVLMGNIEGLIRASLSGKVSDDGTPMLFCGVVQ